MTVSHRNPETGNLVLKEKQCVLWFTAIDPSTGLRMTLVELRKTALQ
jgi:hypothetical protein